MLSKILALALLSSHPTVSFALDPDDEAALADTQKLLNNQQALEAFAKDNPDAKKALDQASIAVGGDKKKQAEMNSLSADVFKDLVKSSNGDSAAMQEKLQQALKDPGAFLQQLTPEQQKRARDLASEMEKQQGAAKK